MRRIINPLEYVGRRFGRLFVESEAGKGKNGEKLANCVCDCGNRKIVRVGDMLRGRIVSCGCKLKEQNAKIGNTRRTHGCTDTKLYIKWLDMKGRCNNPNNHTYKDYGGRGIKVCDEWMDFQVFMEWALSHNYRDDLSLERKDVNGNYAPDNCEWIPFSQQAWNKRNTVFITYRNETKAMGQWAKELGVRYDTLRYRHQRGWSDEEIIEGRRHGKES